MRIDRVSLEGFQSWDDETIDLPRGTTLISGPNGAGKSTIFRGIFAGLYQTIAIRWMPDVTSIGDLVQLGRERGTVDLWFTVDESQYHTHWQFRDGGTDECWIEGDDLDRTSGIRATGEIVEDGLLGMSAESFVNSVYVQQKDLQRLLRASPQDRVEILDGLLGLDRVDRYIDRMERARPATTRVRDDANARIDELESQLDEFPDLAEVETEIRSIEGQRRDVGSELEELDEEISEIEHRRDELQRELDEIESSADEMRRLEERETELRDEIDELETEQERLEERETELRDDRPSDDLDELRDRLTDLRERRTEIETRLSDLPDPPENLETQIEETRRHVERLRDENLEETLSMLQEDRTRRVTELERRAATAETRRRQHEHIEETGECPVCGQSADRTVFEIDPDRIRDKIEQLKTQYDTEIEETEEKISRRDDLIDELDRLEQARDAQGLQTELGELEPQISRIADRVEEMEEIDRELDEAETRLEQIDERLDDLRPELLRVVRRLKDLEVDGDADELETEIEELSDTLAELTDRRSELEERLDDLHGQLTGIRQTRDQIETLEDRLSDAQKTYQQAAEWRQEVQDLIARYDGLKTDLRSQNVALLNRYTEDLFDDLYRHGQYSRVRIGDDYNIQLVRSSGHTHRPGLSSGGESSVLNLALRAGVYRLVAEKESRMGQLPPFMLDEPTQGMDDEHIRQLDDLVSTIRGWDVEQVLMVSHQEALGGLTENTVSVGV